ncbi:MltA domain-containing protein [Ferrovibrio sp.]|uniref:murein transglycosylase A n=1 Tax=Ferrovibrio sp. TaxID=1917215 RepID=UPI001B61183A|nr:MltA domain-containing protein [Ferrovibrio sp.]MBP7062950.1 murein transglycosylase A [Ferrovibrio sp.]
MLRKTAFLALALLAASCAPRVPQQQQPGAAPEPPKAPAIAFAPASFADLPGWQGDRLTEALPAIAASCPRILAQAGKSGPDGFAVYGRPEEWRPFCDAVARLKPADEASLRRLIEAELQPVAVLGDGKAEGLFTGYYEPSLKGSRQRRPGYDVPLYRLPPDLVQVDLGQFRPEWRGQRTAGRVENGFLRPYDDRTGIEAGKLAGRGLELAWAADPVAAFFLQIQGSGRIELAEGGVMRVGFAGQNGHAYTAIGRVLIERGIMNRDEVSMPALQAWLKANPAEAPALLRENRAYIFFRELPAPAQAGDGPPGAQGLALKPGRSLAVDRSHVALGLPLWLAASYPAAQPPHADLPLNRLMVAQDTGGAIRGGVRGDVFWGHGAAAEAIAGRMKHPGRYWFLLPRSVAARLGNPA